MTFALCLLLSIASATACHSAERGKDKLILGRVKSPKKAESAEQIQRCHLFD